jgi:thioredoxin-related protein
MRHALHLLLSLVTLLSAAPAAAARSSALPWRDWDAALAEARSSGRHVLVDVYTDWCGWCRRMDAEVYARPEVREYLARKFVLVKLDAEAGDPARYEGRAFTSRTLAARFNVSGYPTTIFLKADGAHLFNVPGYVPADRFLTVLRFVGEGHQERGESFSEYRKRQNAGR